MTRFRQIALGLCVACSSTIAMAQQLIVEGTLTGTVPEGQRLFVAPVTGEKFTTPDTLYVADGKLHGKTKLSPWGIYRVTGVSKQSQTILPVSLQNNNGVTTLRLAFVEGRLTAVRQDANGKALQAYNACYNKRAYRLWQEGMKMEKEPLRQLVLGYGTDADSILAKGGIAPHVASYIRLWAAALIYEAIEGMRFSTGRTSAEMGFNDPALLKRLTDPIDCEMALSFQQLPRLAATTLEGATLEAQLNSLHQRYQCPAVVSDGTQTLLTRYITTFPFAQRFDEGLAELKLVTEKFGLPQRYVEEFCRKKATVKGTAFPDGVTLYDLNGRKVDISQFQGKYLYIDLWASWCVPCIKEIPYLQKLEKELQNKDVVFLSVSIDKDENAWKQKVNQLKLEGNQFVDRGNKLCEALNVRGIPFFLIYDRQGKLYKYGAYRPSDTRIKDVLEALR